jgi:hypothetical protein
VIQACGTQKSSKVVSIVILLSKNTRALTFDNLCQAGGTTQRAGGMATARSSGTQFQKYAVQ